MRTNDRGRPGEERPLNVVAGESPILDARCRACGHIVWHPTSILTGLGRDCRRAIVRSAREAAA